MSDTTLPGLISTSPVSGATNVPVNANIVLTFDEAVMPVSGEILIREHTFLGTTLAAIDINEATQVTFTGNTVTINPNVNFADGTKYDIDIKNGAIADLSGNPFYDAQVYNFTSGYSVPPLLLHTSPIDN